MRVVAVGRAITVMVVVLRLAAVALPDVSGGWAVHERATLLVREHVGELLPLGQRVALLVDRDERLLDGARPEVVLLLEPIRVDLDRLGADGFALRGSGREDVACGLERRSGADGSLRVVDDRLGALERPAERTL